MRQIEYWTERTSSSQVFWESVIMRESENRGVLSGQTISSIFYLTQVLSIFKEKCWFCFSFLFTK